MHRRPKIMPNHDLLSNLMAKHHSCHHPNSLKAVVLDWAGTTVDFGCFGPVAAFQEVFRTRFIEPTVDEVRTHMGIDKMEHLKIISAIPRIHNLWVAIYGKEPCEADFLEMHKHFDELRIRNLYQYSELIPGLIEVIASLRGMGLRIGSTTGYNSHIAKLIRAEASKNGYWPDCVISASDVPAGRPYPWMCFRNAMDLGVYPMSAMVKVGDTTFDILEGLNAGMWTVAVTTSGNEMGLSHDAVLNLSHTKLYRRQQSIGKAMKSLGAHFLIEDIRGLPDVIDKINQLLASGKHPDDYLRIDDYPSRLKPH